MTLKTCELSINDLHDLRVTANCVNKVINVFSGLATRASYVERWFKKKRFNRS